MQAWEPFRIMRDLMGWDPFREMAPMRAAEEVVGEYIPAFEMRETDEAFVLKADLPGVKHEDLDITIAANRLSVRGRREAEKEQKNETFFLYERTYGTFMRSITLPDAVDAEHINAKLDDGVLTVIIPKLAGTAPRKVEITRGEKKKS